MKTRRPLVLALGLCALTWGAAPAAHAQLPNPYAEDLARLKEVVGFATSALSYVNGFISAVQWLTGVNNPSPGPTLEQIRQTIVDSLAEAETRGLQDDVTALVNNYAQVRNELKSRAEFLAREGGNPDTLMTGDFAVSYLASRLAGLRDQTTATLASFETVLSRRSDSSGGVGYIHDKQAVSVLPAYLALVPLAASTMKMTGEISPPLRAGQDQNIVETFRAAGRTLFRAVGAYGVYWIFEADDYGNFQRRDSAIGVDQPQMFKRQLYSYYHRLSNGALNTVPALRFSQYQRIPLIDSSLTLLEQIKGALNDRGWVFSLDEDRVWLTDSSSDPNDQRTRPSFTSVQGADISFVRACDRANLACPQIVGQGN